MYENKKSATTTTTTTATTTATKTTRAITTTATNKELRRSSKMFQSHIFNEGFQQTIIRKNIFNNLSIMKKTDWIENAYKKTRFEILNEKKINIHYGR